MQQINNDMAASKLEDGCEAEAEYISPEVSPDGDVIDPGDKPFERGQAGDDDDDEDDEDELGLEFIAQVQKEKRESLLQESSASAQAENKPTPQEFMSNNFWKLPIESDEYSLDNLLEDYD